MLSPKIKSDIHELWRRFWASEIKNPLTAMEQITYLIMLKRLENQGLEGKLYWQGVKFFKSQARVKYLGGPGFERLKSLGENPEMMRDAIFGINDPEFLYDAMTIIDRLFEPSRGEQIHGEIYEALLSEITEAGKSGQFYTPRQIIRAMCDLTEPRFTEKICDPACGVAGFLVGAYDHGLKNVTRQGRLEFQADGTPVSIQGDYRSDALEKLYRRPNLQGFDFDPTMVRLGWMNMVLHGFETPQIKGENVLSNQFNQRLKVNGGEIGDFDVVLTNPPFAGNVEKNDIGETLRPLGTNKSELLFVELILQLLREGGRAAVVVPESLLTGTTTAHKQIRRKLIEENSLRSVISLPGGAFQPYTSAKTSILIFMRGGETSEVWFYDVTALGYGLNARRAEQYEKNDLWDLTLKYRLRLAESPEQHIPAFIDDATWLRWQGFDVTARSRYYAQPIIAVEEREVGSKSDFPSSEPEMAEVKMFKGIETIEHAEGPRDWTATADEIRANDYVLSASSYKPPAPIEYDPPEKIIRDLQVVEQKIQSGLGELLAMMEDKR